MSNIVLNYDRKLTRSEKMRWWLGRTVDFLRPAKFWKRKFAATIEVYRASRMAIFDNRPETPARILSNEFWSKEIPRFHSYLGQPNLACVEVGCGSGPLAKQVVDCDMSYLGIDIKDPDQLGFAVGDNCEFFKSDYMNAVNKIAECDVLLSQSALEHFDYDDRFFQFLAIARKKSRQNEFLDCHLVPSRLSLFSYLGHGARQYTIEDLINLYRTAYGEDDFDVTLEFVKFGGIGLFLSHLLFITIPNIFRIKEWRHRFPSLYAYSNKSGSLVDYIVSFVSPSLFLACRAHIKKL